MGFLKRFFTLGKNETYDTAMEFYNRHMFRQSIEKFEEILTVKASPASLHWNLAHFYCGQAHRNLGILLFTLGNFAAAAIEFEKAIEFDPDYMELYHYLGMCYNNIGEFKKAVNAFNKILAGGQSCLAVKAKLGIAFHNLKMWDKAVSVYNEILRVKPNFPDMHYNLGLAYLGQGKTAEGFTEFQKALDINPDYVQARIKLGITHAFLGDFDNAVSHLLVIEKKFPRYADIPHYLGVIHASHDEFPKAIDYFKKALGINPSFIEAKVKLGIILCRIQKSNKGLRELKEAQALDPENNNLEMIITLLKQNRDSPEAPVSSQPLELLDWISNGESIITQTVREFSKHIEINPDFSEIISMIKKFPQDDMSLYEMLIPFLENYIVQHPDYPDFHNNLGMLYWKMKNNGKAELSFKKALKINPAYIEAGFNLFNTLKDQGKFDEALKQGQYLLEKNLTYPDFYCGLGQVYISMGRIDEGRNMLQMALDKYPGYPQAELILSNLGA